MVDSRKAGDSPAFFVSIRHGAKGFTLVELVVTMLLVAILAYVAIPRFDSFGEFDAAGFGEQTRSVIRFAQKTAIAQRRNVAVTYSANAATACSYPGAAAPCVAGCPVAPGTAVLPLPGGGFRAARGATVNGGTICFDAVGRGLLGAGTTLPIEVRNGATILRTIQVTLETGYVN
jgi:MSHA pilin protein MshC